MKIDKYFKDKNHSNETILVTGGNSGIGLEFIRLALRYSYHIIFTSRSEFNADKALKELKKEYPDSDISYLLLDLSNIDSINSFCNQIITEKIDIHHFYHNAGVYRLPITTLTNGYEISYMSNVFGPFLVNEKLIPYFLSLPHKVHINFTYSLTTYYYKQDYLKFNPSKEMNKVDNYAQTKHLIIHLYHYYLKKYQNTNLIFTLSHPGSTYTPLIVKGYRSKIIRILAKPVMKLIFHSPKKASYTYLYSLENKIEDDYLIVPRGLKELSGYPKIKKLKEKYFLNSDKSVDLIKDTLKIK